MKPQSHFTCFCLQVCGGHSNATANGTCPDSRCGGAGCRDDHGEGVCGGEGCNGTVSSSVRALDGAKNASNSLNAATEELEAVAKKVLEHSNVALAERGGKGRRILTNSLLMSPFSSRTSPL